MPAPILRKAFWTLATLLVVAVVAFVSLPIVASTQIVRARIAQGRHLARQSVEFALPGNQIDLPARRGETGLFVEAPELAELLRTGNILYDRDERGEYFQLYSRNHGEGFFFEIVERRGDYQGYGAPNAPFRIAAQKRYLRPSGMPRL